MHIRGNISRSTCALMCSELLNSEGKENLANVEISLKILIQCVLTVREVYLMFDRTTLGFWLGLKKKSIPITFTDHVLYTKFI